ncbi:[protein-PII] uridylyltransferase [Oryzomicrobium sp.]|uniref:[protein-PII] uridylyltransferase n=1 Tax=Oryzomicrobium sp. TaxID=1911578 RepID=UPI0025F82EA0|nr:[protein-PII] uridylyltransferase [Oryzomicrobium sp.]MCE1242779.1 [protein-PII] uridylyltransferase [Oryzomicrobium sp.]
MAPLHLPTDLIPRYRNRLKTEQDALRDAYLADADTRALLDGRAKVVDGALADLWRELELPPTFALAAVGGYGRGELFPASDIDLLILLPGAPGIGEEARLSQLVSLFWDIGLEIGHSVRTVDECLSEADGDITVQTALIEARLLTGDATLFRTFQAGLHGRLDAKAFFKAKKLEQEERHMRYNETPYSLEPNCKESPGGLRDLQVILWIARAAGIGASWAELTAAGLLTAEEEQLINSVERFLDDVRIRLHLHTRRREDRLLFDHQTAVAKMFGFEPTATRRESELLMQQYYRSAKAALQLNTILLQNLGARLFPPPAGTTRPLNERFQAAHDLLEMRADDLFERQPSAILEAFLMLQRHPELRGMTARTLRALYRARFRIDDAFRADPANRALFLELFKSPQGIVHEFRRMNAYGILGRYLPNFGAIVGQMQHDLFHVYTVDQHILQVLRNLRRFAVEEFAHEYPLCSRLINGFERPWVLYIAALFHDIAKGRGGDHSELGTADARAFCESHGLAPEDTEMVVWLVRHHLTMSQVAQKQDISDPDVVKHFAQVVGDERHLVALYLLTVADIRGTSPKVWNAWKGQLLEELYSATRNVLGRGGAPEPHGVIQERQQEALRLLRYFALSDTVHEGLWKQLDTVYFLRHSAEEIAWHTRNLHYRINTPTPIVKARPNRNEEGLQVMVYAPDQPDLFTRICGFFGREGFSIVDAKVHTTRHGYALDSFVLLDVSGRDDYRQLVSYLEHELAQRLSHPCTPEPPPTGRLSRQVKHFPITPEVSIHPDEKGTQFVLSLVAADRPGLLYKIATTLTRHGAYLHTAKIATLGDRVEDVFLLSGGDLASSAGRVKLESELLDELQV